MKAVEQEERIKQLEARLEKVTRPGSGSEQSPDSKNTPPSGVNVPANQSQDHQDDSSDEADSESSEEE
jgi:hypothetical protein